MARFVEKISDLWFLQKCFPGCRLLESVLSTGAMGESREFRNDEKKVPKAEVEGL